MPVISFRKNPYFGGTEQQIDLWYKYIYPKMRNLEKYNCIAIPGLVPPAFELLNKPIVVWLHNLVTQYENQVQRFLFHPIIQEKIKTIIVPSQFAKEDYIRNGFEQDKILVLPNILSIPAEMTPLEKNNNIPQLVYVSSSERGLEPLLRATEFIQTDFTLKVFSYFRPDGIDFHKNERTLPWVNKLRNLEKIKFYGPSYKNTVLKEVQESDFMVYPSVFLETFCLSTSESVGIGTEVLTTPYGALRETLEDKATYFSYSEKIENAILQGKGVDVETLASLFPTSFSADIENLGKKITEKLSSRKTLAERYEMAMAIREKYSVEKITELWLEFDNYLEDE